MNKRSQLLGASSGVLFLALFAIGFVGLADLVPPPEANDDAAEIAELYADNTDRLRAGFVCMMTGAAFIATWAAVISVQLKRIEGRHSPMTYAQLACGAVNVLVVLLPVMVMIVASFRPERDPELTQTLNDLAWIPFIMVFSPVMVQCLTIAVAIFNHPEQTVFPRWIGYFNAWCALLLLPAVLLPFFKKGPFAWHGVLEFWLAAVVFFGWVTVLTWALFDAIKRQAATEEVPAA